MKIRLLLQIKTVTMGKIARICPQANPLQEFTFEVFNKSAYLMQLQRAEIGLKKCQGNSPVSQSKLGISVSSQIVLEVIRPENIYFTGHILDAFCHLGSYFHINTIKFKQVPSWGVRGSLRQSENRKPRKLPNFSEPKHQNKHNEVDLA